MKKLRVPRLAALAVAATLAMACEEPFLVGASGPNGDAADASSNPDGASDVYADDAGGTDDAGGEGYERCADLSSARPCSLGVGTLEPNGVQLCMPKTGGFGWSRCVPRECNVPALDAVGPNDVCIPAGEFGMGGMLKGDGKADPITAPTHTVRLRKRLFVDRFEVSVSEFNAWWNNGNPRKPADGTLIYMTGDGELVGWNASIDDARVVAAGNGLGCTGAMTPSHPDAAINCVTYETALAYCLVQGKRLPTESEWEYVATGITAANPFPWGQDIPPLVSQQSCRKFIGLECRKGPFSAGIPYDRDYSIDGYSPQAIGNLAGNVAEWTLDFAPADGIGCKACYPAGTVVDPMNVTPGPERVLRGGSQYSAIDEVRSRSRAFGPPAAIALTDAVGFRCVHEER